MSNWFERMSLKGKIILVGLLILVAVILISFIWVFVNYGTQGVYWTIVGIVIIIAFLSFIYLESKYPRGRRELSPMERAEREKGYQQEIGRQQAQEDYRREQRERRAYEKRRKELDISYK